MFAAIALGAAQFGVSLLTSVREKEAAESRAEFKEFSLKRQGRLSARQRRIQFANSMSSQRAQIASAGIVGGRTARLLAAEAQNTLTTARQEAQAQIRAKIAGVDVSRIRSEQRLASNVLGSALSFGQSVSEASSASGAASFGI